MKKAFYSRVNLACVPVVSLSVSDSQIVETSRKQGDAKLRLV